jgi:hypothetical protein
MTIRLFVCKRGRMSGEGDWLGLDFERTSIGSAAPNRDRNPGASDDL